MSLRDLKNLAPWQWESKIAQKKHAIGPKGLQDFEQVARVIQNDGKVHLAEKQVACLKRRRATKEADDPAAVSYKDVDNQTSDTADVSLAAATPAVPVKKHRSSATAATPAAPRTTINFLSSGSDSHQKPPSRNDPASTSRRSKVLSTPPGVTTPGFSLSLCPAAYTPGRKEACLKRAAAAGSSADTAAAAGNGIKYHTPAGQANSGEVQPYEKELWTDKQQQQQVVASASKGQPTPGCSRTPAAAAAAATPTAARLLADVFSSSPCVPTPTPYATLQFKCAATPAAAGGEGGSVLKAAGFSGTSSASKPQTGGSSSGGRCRLATAGTPLPRPQFTTTPRCMPPPANRRNNLQQQQTPLGAAAAAAGSRGSGGSSSSAMKRSPPTVLGLQTPSNTTAMDLDPLPTLQTLLSGAGGEHSPGYHSAEGSVNAEGSVDPLLNPTAPRELSNPGLRVCELSLMSPRDQAGKACGGATDSEQSPPAAVLPAPSTAAAAAAGKEPHSSSSTQRCISNSSSIARLPAKLRCKQEASNNRSAALLGQLGVGVASPDSSREASPAAAAASPPLQSLADLADAAIAEANVLQRQTEKAVQGKCSSSSASPSMPGMTAAAAGGGVGGTRPVGSSSGGGKMSNIAPAGRMGLKRLWCQTHAAAMASEAVAAAAVQGSTPDPVTAVEGSTACSTPHPSSGVGLGVRSRSPDSQAVAMSAELLLAAAELDESAAAVQAVQVQKAVHEAVQEPCEAVQGQFAGAATVAMMKGVDGCAEQQQQQQQVDEQPAHTGAKPTSAAAAALFVPKHMKARLHSHRHTAAERQQQQVLSRRYSEHGGAAPASSADVARSASPPGDSLMLPPAAQLRLLQQQQQHPAAAPSASAAAAATVGQPTWAVAIPTAAGTVVASAAQLTSAVAATSSGLQCMPCMVFQPAAAAGQQIGTQSRQQQQQHLSSLPVALQQLNVQRLNQQLAAMGYTRTHNNSLLNNPIANGSSSSSGGGSSSSSSNAGAGTARMAHVTPALHAAQAGLTRTSHTGVLLQSSLPGVTINQTQQPRQQHTAAAAAATIWDQASAQVLRQQQQHGVGAAVAAMVRGRTPEPLIMSAGRSSQQQQQQVCPVTVELPNIEPLKVPATLSDDEAWRLAQANPQVIESEAAWARELLAGVPFAAAVVAPTAAAAAPSAAAALAALPTVGRRQHTAAAAVAAAPAGNSAAAGTAPLAAAAAATSCQGVAYRPSSTRSSMQDVGKQQGQSPSRAGFGVLRTANIINTQ